MRLLFLILLLICNAAVAAPLGEVRAFRTAVEIFRDKKYDVAERSFTEFLAKHSNSEFRAEAVLYLAKSQIHLKRHTEAVKLLEESLEKAGLLADHYRFWVAEAYFQTGQFETAAEKYADTVRFHLDSPLVLEATYNKALCFAKLEKWSTVVELLGPGRSFSTFSEGKPNDRFTIQSILLLAEALFMEKRYPEAEKELASLVDRTLDADAQWRQQFLLARTQMARKHFDPALGNSSNAVALAKSLGHPRQVADSIQVQAEILEQAGRLPEAVEAYEQNLAPILPNGLRRQALFKAIDLTIAQGKTPEAIIKLEQFIAQNSSDTALDLAWFTLGELRLKQLFTNAEAAASGTNLVSSDLLRSAVTNFSMVISNFPDSEFIGKTYLNRGWCRWIEEKYPEAYTNFAEAVVRLPLSDEQGIARFKLADSLFMLGDFSGAVSNYNVLISDFATVPAVKSTLFDQALYQIVRASLQGNDPVAAQAAMGRILEWYPNTGYADRSMLLVGLGLNRQGSPAEARALFSEFLRRWPESPLAPEVHLALSQTHVREGQWIEALGSLEGWATIYTNSVLRPQADFARALATYHTGNETNALTQFTALIAQFPTNQLAAMAQNWIGDFYFNRQDYALAEENYQLVSKLNPSLEVASLARMGAARAAYERDDFKNARTNFTTIINDTNTPPVYVAEAYFGLGDTIFTQFLSNPNTPVEEFREAVQAYTKVAKDTNSPALAALAWGQLGTCHLQWANIFKEPSAYKDAINAFQQVLDSPAADLQGRSQARLGIGKVYEASGQPLVAWEHYSKLLYVTGDEEFDPKCVKEAGLAAARICESQGQWEQAVNVYNRLLALVPALKPAVEKKMASARANLGPVRN